MREKLTFKSFWCFLWFFPSSFLYFFLKKEKEKKTIVFSKYPWPIEGEKKSIDLKIDTRKAKRGT